MAGTVERARIIRRTTLLRATLFSIGVALLTPSLASASPIGFVGTTAGCFGAGCSVFGDSVTNSAFGLTFDGLTFDVPTNGDGAIASVLLGTLSRSNVNVSSSTSPLLFTLELAFSVPGALDDATFSASIFGSSPGGGGPLNGDFSQTWHTLAFDGPEGIGTFDFRILSDLEINKNGASSIFGQIRNAEFSAAEDTPAPAAVPEPTTLLLIGTGLGFIARRARRLQKRRQSSL